jgi:Transposase
MMTTIIDALRRGLSTVLEELAQLGRTLWLRCADILAYFDHHASNGPTEAINGRLETPRRNALGFRNPTHYRTRSLLHCATSHNESMHSKTGAARKRRGSTGSAELDPPRGGKFADRRRNRTALEKAVDRALLNCAPIEGQRVAHRRDGLLNVLIGVCRRRDE